MNLTGKRPFSIVVFVIFLMIVGWFGYQIYRIGVGIEKETRSLSALVWEIEKMKIENNGEYLLKVTVRAKNPSAEQIEVVRLEVAVFLVEDNKTKIYVGGNYRLFEPDPLILKSQSNASVKLEIYSKTLKNYHMEGEKYFYVEIFTLVNTEHIKSVKLKYSYKMSVETILHGEAP